MPYVTGKVFSFGSISFIVSGGLFAAYFIVSSLIPAPPIIGDLLPKWSNNWRTYIAIADELLFFATIFLLLSIYILSKILKSNQFPFVLSGCTIIKFIVIPVFMIITLLQGQLAYPVYDYLLSTDVIYFILNISVGAMHAVSILLSISILLLSFSLIKGLVGLLPVLIGFLTSVCQLVSAYPWLINSKLNLVCQLTFPVWLVSIGVLLLTKKDRFLLVTQNEPVV